MRTFLTAMVFVLAGATSTDAQGIPDIQPIPGIRETPTIGGFHGGRRYEIDTPPPSVQRPGYTPYRVEPSYEPSSRGGPIDVGRIQRALRNN